MGLINHDVKVKTKDEVSRQEIGFGAEPPKPSSVTYRTSINADNHIANQLNALVKIGVGTKLTEVLQTLIDKQVSLMSDNTKNKYETLLDIAEKTDFLTHN